MMILSGDPPRSRILSLLLIVIVTMLALAPFLFPGAKAMNVATKICIFALLVASYDLLLGYTEDTAFERFGTLLTPGDIKIRMDMLLYSGDNAEAALRSARRLIPEGPGEIRAKRPE